jgi:hypothetical protein
MVKEKKESVIEKRKGNRGQEINRVNLAVQPVTHHITYMLQ